MARQSCLCGAFSLVSCGAACGAHCGTSWRRAACYVACSVVAGGLRQARLWHDLVPSSHVVEFVIQAMRICGGLGGAFRGRLRSALRGALEAFVQFAMCFVAHFAAHVVVQHPTETRSSRQKPITPGMLDVSTANRIHLWRLLM